VVSHCTPKAWERASTNGRNANPPRIYSSYIDSTIVAYSREETDITAFACELECNPQPIRIINARKEGGNKSTVWRLIFAEEQDAYYYAKKVEFLWQVADLGKPDHSNITLINPMMKTTHRTILD